MNPSPHARGAEAPQRRPWRSASRALYWILPGLLLYLVFRRIELSQVQRLIASADVPLVLAGLLLVAPPIAAGGIRWHLLLRRFASAPPRMASTIADYWRSLAVGVLVPGSLGSDGYRVVVAGRRHGHYLRSAFVVGVEKLAAVGSSALLILGLYPLLVPQRLPLPIVTLVSALYVLFVAALAALSIALLVRRQTWAQRLGASFDRQVEALARRVAPRGSEPSARDGRAHGTRPSTVGLLVSVFSPPTAVPALGLSLGIQIFSAIQSQVYFRALNYDLPFAVNLFVTPLLFLLSALPISFGGIGIREGAYVVLYGAFGVPPETALVVSLCFSLGTLVKHSVGGALFLSSRRSAARPAADAPGRNPHASRPDA